MARILKWLTALTLLALLVLAAGALNGVSVQSKPALTLARLEVRPGWLALLRGRLEIATLVLRQVVDAILLSLQKKKRSAPAASGLQPEKTPDLKSDDPAAGPSAAPDWLLHRAVLNGVTWVSLKGAGTTVDAEMRLGADRLPDEASLKVVKGHLRGLRSSLQREEAGRWALRIEVGGGTVAGRLAMQHAPARAGRPDAGVAGSQLETA